MNDQEWKPAPKPPLGEIRKLDTDSPDGTAGHSGGVWYTFGPLIRASEQIIPGQSGTTICNANRDLRNYKANLQLIAFAQSAPHDCGNPDCVGVVNKQKLEAAGKPLDMILNCPKCQAQHIDKPQPEKGWTNPPHRSHECQGCGTIWRPADFATNGVEYIKTEGSRDTWFFTPRELE